MLTLERFKTIKNGEIFATGVLTDNDLGLFMTGSKKELRWIVVKGHNNDWCVYCHFAYNSIDYIASYGDKVHTERNIRMCMPCTDEVFALYRY